MSTKFIRYIEGESLIHRLDPRSKLTFVLFMVLCLTLASKLLLVIPLFAISVIYYAMAKLPWSKTKNTWKFILIIVLVLSLLNYFTVALVYGQGSLLEKLTSPRAVTSAVTPVLKLLSLALVTATLVFTTPPNLYAPALGQMGFPYKAAYVIQLALRYVPEFTAELGRTLEAQMARGFRPRGGKNPLARLLAIAPLVVPVTISASLSIYDIADAMELRGFGEERCHTWYRELRLSRGDKLLLAVSCSLGLLYVALFLSKLA